ncbi:MAG: DUF642 domain-containing protein [Planctomycetes bacterium]|nr:DUF642 domain-containing protein [Planctomycetota bacterium]
MSTRRLTVLVGVATLALVPLYSQADLAVNGSFELGPPIPPQRTELTVEGTLIPGWFIPLGNGGVDLNSAFWSPSDGLRSIDLNGARPASIEQTLATAIGARYRVLFDLGATGDGARRLEVSAAGATSPPFTHAGPAFPAVSYARDLSWEFVAIAPTTTLRFASLDLGGNGPHLDHVRVYPLEPTASFTTYGAGCSGSQGVPALAATAGSRPSIGSNFQMTLSGLPSGPLNAAFGLVGVSDTTWAGIPLPFSLAGLGAPGCELLVGPDWTFGLANVGGVAAWSVQVPQDGLLAGAVVFVQGLVFDLAGNGLGVVVSNAGRVGVGY